LDGPCVNCFELRPGRFTLSLCQNTQVHLYSSGADRPWTSGDTSGDPGPVFAAAFAATSGDPASGKLFFAGEFGAPLNASGANASAANDYGRGFAFKGLDALAGLGAPGLPWVWEYVRREPGTRLR